MSPALLAPNTISNKSPISFKGQISRSGTATGIITRMPAAADEVKLVVLNSIGEVASEFSRPVMELGLLSLNFNADLVKTAGNEIYFLMVKGYLKGSLAWEQRLGRFRFRN
jgi:hypothetical protein